MGCSDSKPQENKGSAKNMPKDSKNSDQRKNAWVKIQARLPRKKTAEDKQKRIELFKQFDPNGNGKLSLAEVDKGAREILKLDEFTDHLSPILIRAFCKANGMGGARGDPNYVEFLEFRLVLCFVYDYFELQVMFDEIDKSGDGRITRDEFKKAQGKIEVWGLKIADMDAAFNEIDADKGGMILFSEFGNWATDKKLSADGDPDNE